MEQAWAIKHEGDTYFANSDLSAWRLWYCLDNDTTRFAWADETETDGKPNGRGVIYRMIDEFGNDCPYDFKNIQFYRQWDSRKSLWSTISSDNTGVPCYTFSSSSNSATTLFTDTSLLAPNSIYSNVIGKYVNDNKQTLNNICFFGNSCHSNTFGNSCQGNTFGNSCHSNTFGNSCQGNTFGHSCDSNTFGNNCDGNTFGFSCYYNTFGNNCHSNTFGFSCYSNTFGNNCHDNTFGYGFSQNDFGSGCYYNTFGNDCAGNTFGNNCHSNTFGNICYSNTFGNNCQGNTFGNRFQENTFGDSCHDNTFGSSCYGNTFGNDFQENTFGNNCQQNTFGNYCSYNAFEDNCSNNTTGNNCKSNEFRNSCSSNTFGSGCSSNSFGSNCQSNTFGTNCYNNTFGSNCSSNSFRSNCRYIKFASDSSASTTYNYYRRSYFGDGCAYILFKGAETASSSAQVQNYNFTQGLQGTSSAYLTIDGVRGRSYETYISKDTDGTIKESVIAEFENRLGNCVDLTTEQTINAAKTFSAGIDLNGTRISKVGSPINTDDATNKEYVDDTVNTVDDKVNDFKNAGYLYAGVATTATNPGTPNAKVFYIANGKGTYEKFGGINVTEDEVVVLYWDSAWHKVATGIASQAKLSELELETNHKVFSNGAIFNSIFSEVFFVGFSKDEIASITRVAYAMDKSSRPSLSITINGVIERFSILASLSYSSGINYFGCLNGIQVEGKRGMFVVANGKWADAVEYIQIYSSALDIAQSPSISEHILNLTPQNNILVNLEFAGTSKRIHKYGYIVDANSNWAYTKPIAVTKGDLLKINTEGNATAAVLAKTDADGSYYETIITYNDKTKDYQLLIDFDGYVALSIFTAYSYYLYQVKSPIIKAIVSLIGEQPTELVSVQSIEQIVTSTESGGVNVIECTLTNGTRTQFYIRNGIGGNGGIAVPNFNSIQLLPQRKFKKPLVTIKASEKKWAPSVVSDANVDNTTRYIYDEVYQKMTEVEWVESLNRVLMVYDLPTRMDMSKKVVCGSIYLDEDIADTGAMGETWLRLYSGGINDSEHAIQVQIQWAGAGNENYQRTGWFHFCVCPQANAYSKGASFDIADVHRIAIHQTHTSASVQFGIGDFYIVDGMQKGGVVMLIDNFNPNVPTMADYIASKGLKATLSIVPSWIGNDNLHGTLEQINKCAADGHFIINHTWTHNISNDQTAKDIFDEISKADKWMVRNGFARGSKIVSNPSAAHDLNKYRAYMDSEALMIYHHWTTMGKDNNFTIYYPYYPMSRLLNITSLESSGVEYMINAVDKAVEVGGIAVLGWHGTWFDKANGEADFKRLIDHIASLGSVCTCYLVDDLIEGAYM